MEINRILFITCILFSSCNPRYYFSDGVQTTAFSKRNQFVGSGSVKLQLQSSAARDATKGAAASFSAEAAYSFFNHFAIGAYWSNLNNKRLKYAEHTEGGTSEDGFYNGQRGDVSLIYFKELNKSEILEISGGFGKGYFNRSSLLFPYKNYNLDYNTYFTQLSHTNILPHLRTTIGVKLQVNDYYSIKTSDSFRNLKYDYILKPLERLPILYTRLFFNAEFYCNSISFITQVGCTFQPSAQFAEDVPFYITAGLSFRLGNGISENKKNKK